MTLLSIAHINSDILFLIIPQIDLLNIWSIVFEAEFLAVAGNIDRLKLEHSG